MSQEHTKFKPILKGILRMRGAYAFFMISLWFSLIKKKLMSQEHTKFKPMLRGNFGN